MHADCPGVVQVIESNPVSGIMLVAETLSRPSRNGVVETLAVQRHSLHEEVAGIVIEGESRDVRVGRNGLSSDVNTGRIHCDAIPGAHTVVGDERDAPV